MTKEKYYSRCRLSNYSPKEVLTVLDNYGEFFDGNSTFYEIWSRLDGKTSVRDIIMTIQEQFDVSEPDEIKHDIISIIDDMQKMGLINQDISIVPQINHVENRVMSTYIAITSNCNMHCSHCYLEKKGKLSSISLNQFDAILQELANIGVLSLEISGGEPLMHPYFLDLITIARRYGFYTKLFSNATLINPKNVDCIIQNIDSFRISLDGDEMIHDFRRGKGNFSKTYEALQLLKGCNVQISMTVDDTNYKDICKVRDISKQLKFKFEVSPVVPYSHIQFTHEKLKSIQGKINDCLCGDNENNRANIRGINCEAAVRQIYINSNLELMPCPLLYQDKWKIGSLKTFSIKELLASDRYREVVTSLNKLKSNCSACNKCQFWCAAITEQAPNKISPFCLRK